MYGRSPAITEAMIHSPDRRRDSRSARRFARAADGSGSSRRWERCTRARFADSRGARRSATRSWSRCSSTRRSSAILPTSQAYPRDEAAATRRSRSGGSGLPVRARRSTRSTAAATRRGSRCRARPRASRASHRPGHFRGVATVCLKLFLITAPHRAYFGQKDAQQVAVVSQMVHDLNVDLEIRVMPTVRAADGLALSSRNARLSADERTRALAHSPRARCGCRGVHRPEAIRSRPRARSSAASTWSTWPSPASTASDAGDRGAGGPHASDRQRPARTIRVRTCMRR